MARSIIPDFGIEYPDYKFREWPKYVGLDAGGQALIAEDDEEFRSFQEIAVYPKTLGRDKHGNELVAHSPHDESLLKHRVHGGNSLTDEQPRRGPGRPPKVEAA